MWRANYRYIAATIMILLMAASLGQAQNLNGRSRIELGIGMAARTQTAVEVGIAGVETDIDASGVLGTFGFVHWIQENLAVTIGFNANAIDIGTRVDFSGVNTHTAVISSISMGCRYYLPESTYGTGWRPYMSAAVGPFIGSESKVEVGTTVVAEDNTEVAFGGRLGAGMDIILSRLFMLGIFTGYNVMSDFSNPIGGRTNNSGPDFGVSISLLLGSEN
jgi:hypothetical protein